MDQFVYFPGDTELRLDALISHSYNISLNPRCPWMNVVPYHGKIQDKDADFYRQFKVVISGLDNVEARR